MLESVASYAWSVIETRNPEQSNAPSPMLCESIAPETEDHTSIYTPPTLDAAVSACNLLLYIESNNVDLVVEMAGLARDSADLLIQLSGSVETGGSDLEWQIRAHPLMQAELSCQEADISFLEQCSSDNDEFFRSVLARPSTEFYGPKHL